MRYNLSEVTSIIQDRRTIYPEFFSERKVHRELIEKMINNAIWAPNHGSTQPWRFKVFQGAGIKSLSEVLPEMYTSFVGPDKFDQGKYDKIKNRIQRSSAVVAICMKRDEREKIPEIEEIEAVACAMQNFHLTATAYGIGGFWSTPRFIYTDMLHSFLKLGEKDKCLGFFYLGYPDADYKWPKSQRKPIEYVTEWIT
jgi:nitroreductase